MRRGDFNLAAYNRIFDPSTTRNVNGVWMRDAFPNNINPASRIDPLAQKVLGFDPWQLPNAWALSRRRREQQLPGRRVRQSVLGRHQSPA
jgi:hypothetical protein